VIYQAVLFSSTAQFNILSTEVDNNCTTNSLTAVQRSSSCCCFIIYCLVDGRNRISIHAPSEVECCTSDLPRSNTTSYTVVFVIFLYCLLAGGIEHKFYTAMQFHSFCWQE
jgi:hypothetical protein